MKPARDILKHSSIYGLGQVLGRVASLLLLPLYTRCLTPADYGCVAILDLTAGILAFLLGAGMASAVTRFHFEDESDAARGRVWWTGLSYVAIASGLLIVPLWFSADWLAVTTLGPEIAEGTKFYQLALATMFFGTIAEVLDAYLRVRKWSGLFTALSLLRLFGSYALNAYFLVVMKWGVVGLLTGNLIATVTYSAVMFAIFARTSGHFAIDRVLARRMLIFGCPLIATSLLSLMMHEADRYFLRAHVELQEVGVYSLAYKIGQAVNTLCLTPFTAIWSVVVYEIARTPNAKKQFAAVFEHFVAGLALVLFAASLFARPILSVLATEEYSAAADLVPVICLAFLAFSLHEHFRVPAMLAGKTRSLVPVYLFAAMLNVACNLLLIPFWHAEGAAWASVVTYVGFSFFGLSRYRQIDAYPYSFRRSGEVVVGMTLTWFACRYGWEMSPATGWSVSIVAWLLWFSVLFGRETLDFLASHRGLRLRQVLGVVPTVPNDER